MPEAARASTDETGTPIIALAANRPNTPAPARPSGTPMPTATAVADEELAVPAAGVVEAVAVAAGVRELVGVRDSVWEGVGVGEPLVSGQRHVEKRYSTRAPFAPSIHSCCLFSAGK